MQSINGEIAVEPFQNTAVIKGTKLGAMSVIEQMVTLMPVKVLFSYTDHEISVTPGDFVYINGNSGATPWGKTVYKLDDTKFSLVPKSAIKFVKNV